MAIKIPSYDEVMHEKPIFISEADGYLYVWLRHKDPNDNSIWKVNKQTHEVAYMAFPDYLCNVSERATYVVKPDWEK